MQDVLHGGPGDDLIYGGDDYRMTGGNGAALYIYGDEGNDVIWGKTKMDNEYIWGGEGDDWI